MKLPEEELGEVYRNHSGKSLLPARNCPAPEELAAAAASELSEADSKRLAGHLAVCADCAQEYRMVRGLKPWAAEMAGKYLDAAPAPRSAPANFGTRTLALAASLLLAAAGLGAWALLLRQENRDLAAREAAAAQSLADTQRLLAGAAAQIAELRRSVRESPVSGGLAQPQLNVPIIDLDPRGSVRGSSSVPVKAVDLPAKTELVTCVLNVAGPQSHTDYGLEVFDEKGRSLWHGQGLQKSRDNTFTLVLPRSLIPAGRYQIKLYGGAQRELIEEYALDIRYK